MDKILFELPKGAKFAEIEKIAQENELTLKQSEIRNFDAITFIQVVGSITSLISFFCWLRDKYGRKRSITVGTIENDIFDEMSIYNLIDQLQELLHSIKKDDSDNQD